MKKLEEAVAAYIDAIKSSEEYLDYTSKKNRVKQFPELKARIDEYRRRNNEMQNSENTVYENIEAFEKEYEALWEEPLAADFLTAELAFCRMMQEVNLKITESLDFE